VAAPGGNLPDLEIAGLDGLHHGLTAPTASAHHEAAAVRLAEWHTAPVTFTIVADGMTRAHSVTWPEPSERMRAAHANRDDATRDGACCLAIAAAGTVLGYEVISQSFVGTGADYLMMARGTSYNQGVPLEEQAGLVRLEVSGTNGGDQVVLSGRLGEKVRQLRAGKWRGPGIAVVVGFKVQTILMRSVEE
jgi:hypothetical protein